MKKQIFFLLFLTLPILITPEMELPELTHFQDFIDPEKTEQARIQEALREKAEQNYKNALLFKNTRREKYLKNVQTLSTETQRLLVTPDAHEFSTKTDVDRLNQEIAREKKRSSKLWFNGDKSGTLIKDLEALKRNLQKKQIAKILNAQKSVSSESDTINNTNSDKASNDEFLLSPAEKHFETKDIGSKLENNPLNPKNNFDYDDWKNKLLAKKAALEDKQKEINKKITLLKKQEAYQKDRLLDVNDQKKEIFRQYLQKNLTPEHIKFITQKLVEFQIEAREIEEKRLHDFKFITFGIHDDNERLQELKQQMKTWKNEQDAYDQLQELQEREKTISEKIKNIQDQQNDHATDLKKLDEQNHDLQSSLNNADFHLKRVDKYLNALT